MTKVNRGKQILKLKIKHPYEDKEITIKKYLKFLLTACWQEGEGFSGKRPFGNSGWEYDLYAPLIKAGLVKGVVDEDGYISSISETSYADTLIFEAIDAL